MKVLITGAHGLLGQKVLQMFSKEKKFEILATAKQEKTFLECENFKYKKLDITKKEDVEKIISNFKPDVVINTAAYTNVDGCEVNKELAWNVNVEGVRNIVSALKNTNSIIIHISTDYIFDGKAGPYTENDKPNPINFYGRTKLESESVIKSSGVRFLIFRTNVLYGNGKNVKKNFALWLYEMLSAGKKVRIVTDQIGNPTFVDDLAFAILKAVELGREGVYNLGGSDFVSRFDFALIFAEIFGFDKSLIQPVETSELKQTAPRPLRSGLVILKAQKELMFKPRGVKDGIIAFKESLG